MTTTNLKNTLFNPCNRKRLVVVAIPLQGFFIL